MTASNQIALIETGNSLDCVLETAEGARYMRGGHFKLDALPGDAGEISILMQHKIFSPKAASGVSFRDKETGEYVSRIMTR